MNRFLPTAFSLLVAVCPVLAGNGDDGPGRFGAPNPAATHCLELDGISSIANREHWGGPLLGLCRLRDDGVVVDWTLFHAARGTVSQAVEAFASSRWVPSAGPIEGWADEACADAGGLAVDYVEHLRPGGAVRLCEFPDGSAMEVWTLFGGPGFYPKLARACGLDVPAGALFRPCPWPRTCMAPCLPGRPPQGLCLFTNGHVEATTFACCCCGSGINSFAPLTGSVIPGRSKRR
jgi:putative hemolysin